MYFGEKTEMIFLKIDERFLNKIKRKAGKRGVSEFIRQSIIRKMDTLGKRKIKMLDNKKESTVAVKMTPEMRDDILKHLENPKDLSKFIRFCVSEFYDSV